MKKISEVIAEMKLYKNAPRIVDNWKDMIPAGSRWMPGDKGDPACPSCKGTGYVRVDLPIAHPDFGKLFECDCVSGMVAVNPSKGLNLPRPI